MPVRSSLANLYHEEKTLYQFLEACQAENSQADRSPIISLVQPIRPIDLLNLLETVKTDHNLHFFWENKNSSKSVLAYGSVQSLTLHSSNRFLQANQFVEHCLERIIPIGNSPDIATSPRLFCNFSFFDGYQNPQSPFPLATIFLPEFQIIQDSHHATLIVNFKIDQCKNIQTLLEEINHQIDAIYDMGNASPSSSSLSSQPISFQLNSDTINSFISAVQKTLYSIKVQRFSKLVLANALDITFPQPIRLVDSLRNLRQQYPNCYVFSTSNGQGHNFIGASPERLVCIQDRQLVTDALAGSIPRGKTPEEDVHLAKQLLNSEKERREHQAVIEFILYRLRQLGLNPLCSPLTLFQLSNIQHLWTPIHAKLLKPLHPLDVVARLHPTPAVAGVPTAIACQEIRRYETFDRSLYAAPLGWVDSQGNGEFIVGIRSALLQGNQARLYAGAGIVAGSDPERELAEIQLKFQALLKALV